MGRMTTRRLVEAGGLQVVGVAGRIVIDRAPDGAERAGRAGRRKE